MNPYLASPLYFDPRIFPHTGHGQSRARQHRKCEANGTNCNNRSISDVIRGELVRSLYCEYHHCRMVEGGRMCRVAKAPRNERYCNEHLRCTAVDRGLRCGQRVKDENPNRYAFCAEFHLCPSDGCTGQRPGLGEEPSPFCPSHRCRVPGCREETTDKGYAITSPYCRVHTCEYQDCSACVPHDSGFADYAQRLCERHRRCGVPRCERPCHIRAGGALAPFCEAHCCDAGNCERERPIDGGKYCPEHRCAERDCRKARSDGPFCKEHKCLSRNCQQVRMATSGYCVYHGCVSEGCDMEAGPDRYCSAHQRCVESGCAGRRFTLNGVPYPTCEDHHFGVCRGLDGHRMCGRRAAEGTGFCEDHLCVNRQCPEPRVGYSSHCHRHKCSEPDCPRPRGGVVLAAAAATIRGEPVARLASTLPDEYLSTPYCEMHTCGRPGCRDRVAGLDLRYCIDHTPYQAQGYGRPVDLGGMGGGYYWGPRINEREREGVRQPGRQRGRQPDREWPDRGRQNSDRIDRDRLDRGRLDSERERDLGWDARRQSHFRRPSVDRRHVEEDPWRAFGLRP